MNRFRPDPVCCCLATELWRMGRSRGDGQADDAKRDPRNKPIERVVHPLALRGRHESPLLPGAINASVLPPTRYVLHSRKAALARNLSTIGGGKLIQRGCPSCVRRNAQLRARYEGVASK